MGVDTSTVGAAEGAPGGRRCRRCFKGSHRELEKGRADNPSMALVQRLADHFGVSIGFLVGEDIEAPDADVELARMFRQASRLEPNERALLDDMMKSLLKRRQKT